MNFKSTGLTPTAVVNDASVNPIPAQGYQYYVSADGIHTYIVGVAYAGALWKSVSTALLGYGNLELCFNHQIDAPLLACSQAFEFDSRITDTFGNTFIFDMQFNVATGMIQVGRPAPTPANPNAMAWENAAPFTGLLPLNTVSAAYVLNSTAKTASVTGVTLNGKLIPIPAALQNTPAQVLGWAPNQLVIQKQIDLGANGGCGSDLMTDLQFSWGN